MRVLAGGVFVLPTKLPTTNQQPDAEAARRTIGAAALLVRSRVGAGVAGEVRVGHCVEHHG
jgi:hypothetical protein